MNVEEAIKLKLVHEIHTSGRKSYRACRRRWDWIFRQNYYPIMTAKPLEFGSAFHYGMEYYYAPETWAWDREVVGNEAILKFIEKCEEQKKAALEATGQNQLDSEVEADYNERVELGKGMFTYYFKEIAPILDKGWVPIRVEVPFMVPIPHPDNRDQGILCTCLECVEKYEKHFSTPDIDVSIIGTPGNMTVSFSGQGHMPWEGLPVVYAGRIDMLAQDDKGHLWIFDWKTAASITVSGEKDEFLELDDQVGSYVWALKACGLDVRGFIYHEQKKGYPLPPKQNVNRRLGRLFSVSQNQNTDYDTYLKTVSEQDTAAWEEGLYDEFLTFLRNEGIVFYSRHQLHKTDVQCLEIERNIGLEALEMCDPNLRIYPSPGRFGCGFCAFRDPCLSQNDGGDYRYTLETLFERREHYYIRNAPSTESKGGE